jgi:hypothetical protein
MFWKMNCIAETQRRVVIDTVYDFNGVIRLTRTDGKYAVIVDGKVKPMPSESWEINPILAKQFFLRAIKEQLDGNVRDYLIAEGMNHVMGCHILLPCTECRMKHLEENKELPEDCKWKG